jgi:hypothetical protein
VTGPDARRFLAILDSFITLAQKGAVREAMTMAVRLHADAVRNNAFAYEALAQGGAARLEWSAKGDGYREGVFHGGCASAGIIGGIALTGTTGGLAAAGYACAVVGGWGLGRIIRHALWEED